jgi:hypothetical protein
VVNKLRRDDQKSCGDARSDSRLNGVSTAASVVRTAIVGKGRGGRIDFWMNEAAPSPDAYMDAMMLPMDRWGEALRFRRAGLMAECLIVNDRSREQQHDREIWPLAAVA